MSCWRQQIHKLRKLASRTETQLERTSEMSRGNEVSSSYNANLSTANKQKGHILDSSRLTNNYSTKDDDFQATSINS